MPAVRSIAALADLSAPDVRFIVVGGVAAVLHGAPVQTFDIHFVYSLEPANLDRLADFLKEPDAIFRIQTKRCLRRIARLARPLSTATAIPRRRITGWPPLAGALR
jgi:hypothetical protein